MNITYYYAEIAEIQCSKEVVAGDKLGWKG
jgi:hypothetical protein